MRRIARGRRNGREELQFDEPTSPKLSDQFKFPPNKKILISLSEMKGEGGADNGGTPAPPRPPLTYEHLAFFEETRCIQPEHELAVKQHLYNRTFGMRD